jgi:cell division protein FtsB
MSAVAQTTRRPLVGRRRRALRAPFAGGVVWIVAVGVILAGVVAVNVLVLQLNVQLDVLGRERAELKADIATARAQLSTASSNVSIETRAASTLGLVQADPALTTYVRLDEAGR